HAGLSPTRVTSWPSARSSRSRERASASDPPIVERSFFAMTTRTRGRLGERLVCRQMRTDGAAMRVLDTVHDALPVPPLLQLGVAGAAHRTAKGGVIEETRHRARDIDDLLRDEQAIDSVRDHFAQRRDVAADHGLLVQPRFEITDAERFVHRWHRIEVARIECGRLLRRARAFDLDDAVVRVTRELVDHRTVEPRHADEDEPSFVVALPHELCGVEEVDVALVPFASSDVEDHRRVRWDAMARAESSAVVRTQRVRAHTRRDHAVLIDAQPAEPGALPVGHRRDDRCPPVTQEVRGGIATVELTRMRERSQNDRQVELVRDAERAIEVLAPDVVDQVAVLGMAFELLDPHQVHEGGCVGDVPEEAAARLHLDDVDAAVLEAWTRVERLAANDTHVVTARGKARRPLIGEALRSTHRRVRALGKEDLHPKTLPCKVAAEPRVRMRPRSRPYR